MAFFVPQKRNRARRQLDKLHGKHIDLNRDQSLEFRHIVSPKHLRYVLYCIYVIRTCLYMYLLVHKNCLPPGCLPCSNFYKPISLPIASKPHSLNTQPVLTPKPAVFLKSTTGPVLWVGWWWRCWIGTPGEVWWSFVGEDTSISIWLFYRCTLPKTNSLHLKIDPRKRRFLLETTIFRCYVSFRECKSCFRNDVQFL